MSARPVLIMAGGTGGHIFPGLAVAAALAQRQVPVLWLGSRAGMENRLVPEHGIPLHTLQIGGLRGKSVMTRLLLPLRLLRAIWQAARLMRRQRPRAVLSFGGYVAGPGGLAAWLLRCPLLVHEQNRAPGLTNRVLARLARRVLSGFPDAFAKADWVGNPVRREITAILEPAARFNARSGPLRLLLIGGSQGARALNVTMPAVMAALSTRLPQLPELRHQCGRVDLEATTAAYAAQGLAVQPQAFIDDMAAAYAWADLVICRAGALTLAELCAAGLPSLLVPLPTAADDHQTRNAEFLVEHGAALLLPQGEQLVERLIDAIAEFDTDRARLLAMAEAARGLAKNDAAERVADICLQVAA